MVVEGDIPRKEGEAYAMRGQDVLLSRKSDEYETPIEIFKELDAEFCFTLDPCATARNAKCMTYFTKEDDGLSKTWGGTEFSATHHTRR